MTKDNIIRKILDSLPDTYYYKKLKIMKEILKENNIEYDEQFAIYNWSITFFCVVIHDTVICLSYIIDYEKVKKYTEKSKNNFIRNDNLNIIDIMEYCDSKIIKVFYSKYDDLYNDYIAIKLSML